MAHKSKEKMNTSVRLETPAVTQRGAWARAGYAPVGAVPQGTDYLGREDTRETWKLGVMLIIAGSPLLLVTVGMALLVERNETRR